MILGIISATPTVATAQTRQGPTQPQGPIEGTDIPVGLRFADLRLGPVFLQPRIALKELGWDTNVLGATDASGAKIEDFRATPSAGLKLAIPIRTRHLFTTDGQLDYQWFYDSEELRALNTALDAGYEYTADTWDIEINNRYADTATTQLDRLDLGDTPVSNQPDVFLRARQRLNITSGVASWDLSARVVVEGRVDRRFYTFEDDALSRDLGRTEKAMGGSLGYRLTSATTASLVADWQFDDYTEPGNLREAETYRVGAQVDLDPTALISGSVLVAYRDQAPRNADVIGFEGFVARGDISLAPRDLAEITFSGYRDIFPTVWANTLYGLREGVGASLLFQVGSGVAIGAGGTYYEHNYPNEATREQSDGTLLTAIRLDRIVTFDARARITINPLDDFTIRIGQYRRTSNFDVFDSSGLIFATGYGVVF